MGSGISFLRRKDLASRSVDGIWMADTNWDQKDGSLQSANFCGCIHTGGRIGAILESGLGFVKGG